VVTKRTLPTFATVVFAAATAACARQGRPTVSAQPVVVSPAPAAAAPTPAPTPAPVIEQQGEVVAKPAVVALAAPDSVYVSPTDVTRRAAEVFGDSSLATVAAPADATTAGPSWDIEVHSYESTDRVEHYVRLFSGRAKEHIESRLERGTRYEPMIRAKLREGGLPEDMYYLALVESGFDPNAYSRAAAVGMWQFMTTTARDMGLRVDWWVDERRDPAKSTAAAVRFIKELKEQFGSLYLAAAAYNGGPGRIARGLTRYADDFEGTAGDDLFFALAEKDYLRNETREYVPQLIAAALIAKEPARYGMKLTPQPAYAYDSVRVGPATPLAAVAHASNTPLSDVKELNPHVLRGITPPKDSFFVRVPVGAADSFPEAFAALPKSERKGLFTVESKKGESFESISRKSGISAKQLTLFNPKLKQLKSGNLAAGQTVVIPTEAVASAAASVPDPSIERYGSSKSATTHVVKPGETLGAIAKKYHTSTAALMKSNGLRRAKILPGQSLIVAGSKRVPVKAAARATTKTPAPPAKAKHPAKKKKSRPKKKQA
jgi:membrane-bound lytic murein transglycosylase D